ncbi:MAG: pantothenate kinase [Cyanobacteria bacterium]|nr:pantothenate kinase [Cyanobacteriota bacterium]MDW8202843.1 pantothenate kinase [Cyanobacteriota bacterium SKYGB_h_bin112]
MTDQETTVCLLLAIGNSRLHWGLCQGSQLQATWDTNHFTADQSHSVLASPTALATVHPAAAKLPPSPILTIASVVPSQTALWQSYPHVNILTLGHIPLHGLYPTLGIDRALAAYAAVETIGAPVLVIDGGTALTFTGVDGDRNLVGGAILPGLALQYRALAKATAMRSLPDIDSDHLPLHNWNICDRWAQTTVGAIHSGVIHTLLAGIQAFVHDWWQRFPQSAIVLTGGDSAQLLTWLQHHNPVLASQIHLAPHLVLQGMAIARVAN